MKILQRGWRSDRLRAYAILATVIGIMLFTVRGTFNATGYLTAWDAGGHLLKAHYFAQNMLPAGNSKRNWPLPKVTRPKSRNFGTKPRN